MAQQCIWASAPGRTGNLHVSGSGYEVGANAQYDRAAVCTSCGGTIGVFIAGEWFDVLRMRGGRIGYQKAAFAQFGEQLSADESADSQMVGKTVRV